MYNKIVNPQTGRKVSVYGKLGQSILRNYLRQIGGNPKVIAGAPAKPRQARLFCIDHEGNLVQEKGPRLSALFSAERDNILGADQDPSNMDVFDAIVNRGINNRELHVGDVVYFESQRGNTPAWRLVLSNKKMVAAEDSMLNLFRDNSVVQDLHNNNVSYHNIVKMVEATGDGIEDLIAYDKGMDEITDELNKKGLM